MHPLMRLATGLALLAVAGPSLAKAQVTAMTPDVVADYDPVRPDADFIRRVVMIPMRDGVKLNTIIVMKKGTRGGPMLLTRTPYNATKVASRLQGQKIVDVLQIMDAEFVEDGYIRVYQDIRGTNRSEGEFVMLRPIRGPLNTSGIDEATDAFDTIDWLVKNVPESNGRVGVIGSSYPGFTTLLAGVDPHPALKAIMPMSPMVDIWVGDDAFHNGAYRNFWNEYTLTMSTAKAAAGAVIPEPAGDAYTHYLAAGSTGDYVRRWGIDQYPYIRKVMEHPAYDQFWSLQAVDKWLAARPLKVPTMLVVSQWDQEDSYGAPAVYRALEPKDTNNDLVSLVIGPWRHSGALHYGYELGPLTFTGDTAHEFRVRTMKPFFDHYLKDGPDPQLPPVQMYATGVNRWQRYDRWPAGTATPLYLDANGTASFQAPDLAGIDRYISDPASPVPFVPRPITMSDGPQWKTWLLRDQRFVSERPDVLSYRTAPLTRPVHIAGAPSVDLYAATTGTDGDWVVKLIDVYPDETPEAAYQGARPAMDGYELPLGIEIFRGRYVRDFARPQALTPGKVERYRFDLPNIDHVVLPGHRLMVQIQSSLFPLYDRNPQRYVANIFNAKAGDYGSATQSIYRGGKFRSAVMIPIVPGP